MTPVTKKKFRGFTLIEVMIVVAIIGILSAIAIPNFMRFQAKSKQSEAKTNLKALYTAQKAYFGEKDRYLTNFKTIGFEPESGNRYTYSLTGCAPKKTAATDRTTHMTEGCLGQDAARFLTPPAAPSATYGTIGVNPSLASCPSCDFTATAAGNADNDPAADGWAVTSSAVTIQIGTPCGTDATFIAAGEPTNGYNDVTCP